MQVMLVDDHPLIRNGVASLLTAAGHEVVAEAGNGREAVHMLSNVAPDMVLMDINMPEVGGLDATRLIKSRWPDTRIVMLTVSDDEQDLFEAIKSGAHSYLLKDLEADEFLSSLDKIQEGEAVVPARLAGNLLSEFSKLAGQVRPQETDDGNGLTPREQEILALVAQGLTNKEIAARCFITENTVKFHMKHILEKLHVHNRAQVVAWAATHEVIGR